MLLAIYDYLDARGKKLLLVIPPGKPSFISQKLPNRFQNSSKKLSNRQAYIKEFSARGIPYLAFEHFSSDAQSEPYLYPASGLHWSHMGATWAMDTLIHRIEKGIRCSHEKIADRFYYFQQ